jgi:hypothetical protein
MLIYVIIAVATWQIYKAAKDTGRNAALWAVITAVGSLVFQLTLGIGFGLFYALGIAIWQWPEEGLETYSWPAGIVISVLNVVGIWLIHRHVSAVKEDDDVMPPPPPPTFNQYAIF